MYSNSQNLEEEETQVKRWSWYAKIRKKKRLANLSVNFSVYVFGVLYLLLGKDGVTGVNLTANQPFNLTKLVEPN